jgi:hypothetical protein
MIAYLIDPFAKTVDAVDYDGDYKHIYALIDADTFDCARFNEHGDGVFVDDEGLISGKSQEFFAIQGYSTPLAGKGLVLGCNMRTGDSAAPHVDLNWLREHVVFVVPVKINGELAFLPTGRHGDAT